MKEWREHQRNDLNFSGLHSYIKTPPITSRIGIGRTPKRTTIRLSQARKLWAWAVNFRLGPGLGFY
jgi:hypothetical protein